MAIQNPSSVASPFIAAPLSIQASFAFLRPNDTTQYGVNDVIGAGGSSGAILPFVFRNVPATGGEIVIDGVRFEVDDTALIGSEASHAIAFYNVAPPSGLADNAAYDILANDRQSYQGVLTLGTPVDLGSTLYVEITKQEKRVTLLSQTLYAYLTTAGAYIPTAFRGYRLFVYGRLI